VLLDGQLRRLKIDLLHDESLLAVETELSATAGTAAQGVNQEEVDLISGEKGAFVPGMAWLATPLAFVLSSRPGRRWLDDVRRGRLGGSRGVFPRGGELLLQTSHGSLQLLELLLQPLASGTGVRCCFGHATVLFSACLSGEQWT
jgi:hypothetical protein